MQSHEIEFKCEYSKKLTKRYLVKNTDIGIFDVFSLKKYYCQNWTIVQFKLVISFSINKYLRF